MIVPGSGEGARPEVFWAAFPIAIVAVLVWAVFNWTAAVATIVGLLAVVAILSEVVRRRMPADTRYAYMKDRGADSQSEDVTRE